MYHESIDPNDYMKITEDNEQPKQKPMHPAFPLYAVIPSNSKLNPEPMVMVNTGMTLRDYFAAKTAANPWVYTDENGVALEPEIVAGICYRMADAMIKAREL